MSLSREVLARRIREAIAEAGSTQQDLARATGMDPTALSKALAGRREFKSLEVALIAEQLGLSTQWLLADDDTEEGPHRIAARATLTERRPVDQAVAVAEQINELDQLLTDLGYPSPGHADVLPAIARKDPVQQGYALANGAHQEMALGTNDLPPELDDLAALVEETLGIDVTIQPLPAGVDGLALSTADLRLALVSSGVSATRQRFTLAHELGHLFAGDAHELTLDEDVFGDRSREERRANAFAAAFLMPESALRAAARPGEPTEPTVVELLGRLRVSLDALAFRMHNLGIVNAAGRDRLRAMSSSGIALRPGRTADLQARNERRAPGLVLQRAVYAFVKGDLGVRPLARLLNVEPDDLLAELTPPKRRSGPGTGDSAYPVYAL